MVSLLVMKILYTITYKNNYIKFTDKFFTVKFPFIIESKLTTNAYFMRKDNILLNEIKNFFCS